MECGSLMPRPYAHACERVCLHQSKFLDSLQNLKVTNEIVSSIYWNNEVAKVLVESIGRLIAGSDILSHIYGPSSGVMPRC